MRQSLRSLTFVFTLLVATAAAAQSPTEVTFERSALVIVGEAGRNSFDVELALTPDQRSRGLMYRRAMAPNAGMLFDFGKRVQRVSMWMKNTILPLDMLFIDADGRIESIAERTVPQSLVAISSRGLVRGVLELNGGTVSRLGIKPGDRVEHPIFGNEK
jgi:uncharacterized membrane protein (UPF0127 family)